MAVPVPAKSITGGQAATPVLSAGVVRSLEAAQEAIRTRHWGAALAAIKAAQGVSHKTAMDEYDIDELLAYTLYRQNKYAQAVIVFERLLGSPLMPATQRAERTEAVAEMYFRLGNYAKAARWAGEFLQRHSGNAEMSLILGDSYFRMSHYREAAATMSAAVADLERTKRVPPEAWLRIIEDSDYRLEDVQGMKRALLQIVRYYPRPEDWSQLIDLSSQDVRDSRVALGYRRLMLDLDVLKRPDDYESMAIEALEVGLPAEALHVLQQGERDGVFMAPDVLPGRHERLLELAQERTAANRLSLPQLAAKAMAAATGQADVLVGQMYLSYGKYEQAVDALRSGIAKGLVNDIDEAHISLGIAYLKEGRKELAERAFGSVPKGSKWSNLAELWALRVADSGLVPLAVHRWDRGEASLRRESRWSPSALATGTSPSPIS